MRTVLSLGKFALATTAVAVLLLASAPLASANSVSFNLSSNNLGIPGSIGTVNVTDTGANQVTVTITMNAGFSVQLKGDQVIAFNGTGLPALTLSDASGTFNKFSTNRNVASFGTFAFDYGQVTGLSKGVVSADSLTFVLTASGLTASQFTGVAIHFCTASGANCGPQTGFASSGPPTTVPEPGTMTLLGSGLVGLAGLVRRRYRSL